MKAKSAMNVLNGYYDSIHADRNSLPQFTVALDASHPHSLWPLASVMQSKYACLWMPWAALLCISQTLLRRVRGPPCKQFDIAVCCRHSHPHTHTSMQHIRLGYTERHTYPLFRALPNQQTVDLYVRQRQQQQPMRESRVGVVIVESGVEWNATKLTLGQNKNNNNEWTTKKKTNSRSLGEWKRYNIPGAGFISTRYLSLSAVLDRRGLPVHRTRQKRERHRNLMPWRARLFCRHSSFHIYTPPSYGCCSECE